MGWLLLAALIAAAIGGLWVARVRGPMLQLSAAALVLGGAGYALQGRPGLKGSPSEAASARQILPLSEARRAFFGDFPPGGHWLIMADSRTRRGDTSGAVGVLRSAVRENPRNAQLWIGLGNALVDHASVLTPAAQLAFTRASELAPDSPAPPFFLGLALARSGDRNGAVRLWRRILAGAPANAGWRPLVEDAIVAVGGPRSTAP